MMRFEFEGEAGWKSLSKCSNSMQLYNLLQVNMDALAPLDMTQSATHSACFEDARVRYVLSIIKCSDVSVGGSVVVRDSVWELCPTIASRGKDVVSSPPSAKMQGLQGPADAEPPTPSGCISEGECIWCHVRTPRDSVYYRQELGSTAVRHARASLTEMHARAELVAMPLIAKGLHPETQKPRAEQSWRSIEIVVRVSSQVCRVMFSSDDSVKSLHLFSPARCVNACYTTCIVGTIEQHHQVKTINTRAERGPCGSELYISSVFGVFQIFPSSFGARRVTCKAFADVASAEFALEMTCNGLGVSVSSPLLVHMIVMHGNTGRQLDISPCGNLVYCIQRKFRHVAYTEKLDEVNVHAIFKWHDVTTACAVCPQALQNRMANKFAILQRVELTVSVTRLGTCIYRVGVKKAPVVQSESTSLGFAEPETADVEQSLFALCAYIHEFITQEA